MVQFVHYNVKRSRRFFMEEINSVVSANLRRLRVEKKLSLDAVARLTGVSKSMLNQIERGDVNPTISTVWKIANGFRVSFTELMTRPEVEIEVVDKALLQPLTEDEGRYRNYPMFPYDNSRRFEIYFIELDEGACLKAEAHPTSTQEFITVFEGTLEIAVGERNLTIGAGSGVRFKADQPHEYRNNGDGICRLSMVIYYPS